MAEPLRFVRAHSMTPPPLMPHSGKVSSACPHVGPLTLRHTGQTLQTPPSARYLLQATKGHAAGLDTDFLVC